MGKQSLLTQPQVFQEQNLARKPHQSYIPVVKPASVLLVAVLFFIPAQLCLLETESLGQRHYL